MLVRLGGAVLTFIGAFSFSGIVGTLGDATRAAGDNPLGAISVAVGVAMLVYGFRDAIIGSLGVARPRTIERSVRDWLDAEHYTVTKSAAPPDNALFSYTAADAGQRKYVIAYATNAPVRIEIAAAVRFSTDQAEHMTDASNADWRALMIRLAGAASGPTLSSKMENIGNGSAFIFYVIASILAHDVDFQAFFEHIHQVRGCVMQAQMIMGDVAATVAERTAPPIPPPESVEP